MKSLIKRFSVFVLAAVIGGVFVAGNGIKAYADDEGTEEEEHKPATSISISPVSKILQLSPNSVYDDSFKVSNNGTSEMKFEVYAAPYAYSYSEQDDAYRLGFNKENTYTQITRWITFKDTEGNYVEKTTFVAEPDSSTEIFYKISTPDSIPAGGQYAVLFAHTLSGESTTSGIKTEASPGLVVYGRADGETIIDSEVSDVQIKQTASVDGNDVTRINGTGKVKNTGNVDFMASGVLKVTGVFGNAYYETPGTSTRARLSVIPEAELAVSDTWDDTPFFGMFNTEWTIYVNGEAKETVTKFVMIMPPILIVFVILLLTIVIVWITIMVRKRKERRSKFMV